jgi:hypothetical protein
MARFARAARELPKLNLDPEIANAFILCGRHYVGKSEQAIGKSGS